MAEEIKKKTGAGEHDTDYKFGYTEFAGKADKTEIKVANGEEFDNTALLEMLGFKQNNQGIMILEATGHESVLEGRDASGKLKIKSRKTNGRKMKDSIEIEKREKQAGKEI